MSACSSYMNSVEPPQLVGGYPDSPAKILSYQAHKLQQYHREQDQLRTFTEEREIEQECTDVFGRNSVSAISGALTFWCTNSSKHCDTADSV